MRAGFEPTYLVLLAELWNELDEISISLSNDALPQVVLGARAEAFLIELDLLDSAVIVWRRSELLTAPERDRVARLIAELRALLDFAPLELPSRAAMTALLHAQNRVFDEVCGLCPRVAEGFRESA